MLTEIILDNLVELIIGGIGLALSSFASALYIYLKRKDEQTQKLLKQIKTIERGISSILAESLIKQYNTALNKGYCTIDDRKQLVKLHEIYHDLGGNGVVDKIMTKLHEMPTKPGGGADG